MPKRTSRQLAKHANTSKEVRISRSETSKYTQLAALSQPRVNGGGGELRGGGVVVVVRLGGGGEAPPSVAVLLVSMVVVLVVVWPLSEALWRQIRERGRERERDAGGRKAGEGPHASRARDDAVAGQSASGG